MEVNHKVNLEVGNYRIFSLSVLTLYQLRNMNCSIPVINRRQKAFNNTEGAIKNGQSKETGNIG